MPTFKKILQAVSILILALFGIKLLFFFTKIAFVILKFLFMFAIVGFAIYFIAKYFFKKNGVRIYIKDEDKNK